MILDLNRQRRDHAVPDDVAYASDIDEHSTRLVWNGVSGWRQIEVHHVALADDDFDERREERVLGEVCEPLS